MKILLGAALLSLPAAAAMACDTVSMGDMTIQHAWSKATVGAARPAVLYVEMRNGGETDDVLTGIATPVAGRPMLHETTVKDGVASMPHVTAIPVAAGEGVDMQPGGYHGMLMDLTAALKAGDRFPVTLTFRDAGDITVMVDVVPLSAEGPDCSDAG